MPVQKISSRPECEKLAAVQPRSQAIGEFLEWLEAEKKISLATYHVHGEACEGWDADEEAVVPTYRWLCTAKHEHHALCTRVRDSGCDLPTESLSPVFTTKEKLLAEFFDIDLKKVEAERDALLAELREARQ